jgi:transcriptional regulator GlxA family with amidase domain
VPAHRVVVPVFDGIQPLDVTGPFEVLSAADHLVDGDGYDLVLVAREPGPVVAPSGLQLVATDALPEDGPIGTLLVPGGSGSRAAVADAEFVAWLGRAAARAERVASVCTGAFLLAAAGLLDGRRAATHCRWAGALAAAHPAVDVRPDSIYERSGRIWTSAGVTAGLDLAREFVVFLRRPGGQSQFTAPVWTEPAPRPSVRAAQDLVHADPTADLRVPVLAAHVGMSERHFGREFARLVGCPPGDYVEQVRVDTARRLLEAGPLLVGVAAARAGFGSAETMRRAFLRRLGVPPDHYRRRFGAAQGS